VTLLHAISLGVSAVCVLGTVLVAVGRRGDASTFRSLAWTITPLVAAGLVAGVIWTYRRWLDIPDTAALVDQRGELTDRLTTLVDLRRRPRPSRLAPVLIAQTLGL